jgi:hypothetical protein
VSWAVGGEAGRGERKIPDTVLRDDTQVEESI